MAELRKTIIIKTKSYEEEWEVAKKIHEQLKGNKDYIENRIILSMSKEIPYEVENEVHLYIFDDAESNPEIRI